MDMLTRRLQDADPIRHEPSPLDAARLRMRAAVLHAGSGRPERRPASFRLLRVALVLLTIGSTIAIWYSSARVSAPVQAAVRFELRLAEDQPAPGLVAARVSTSGRMVYLHPEAVADNADIARASVVPGGPNTFSVVVAFSGTAADRLREFTSRHLQRPIAVLIDGDVLLAPLLRSPLTDSALITGAYTRAEAERLADALTP